MLGLKLTHVSKKGPRQWANTGFAYLSHYPIEILYHTEFHPILYCTTELLFMAQFVKMVFTQIGKFLQWMKRSPTSKISKQLLLARKICLGHIKTHIFYHFNTSWGGAGNHPIYTHKDNVKAADNVAT